MVVVYVSGATTADVAHPTAASLMRSVDRAIVSEGSMVAGVGAVEELGESAYGPGVKASAQGVRTVAVAGVGFPPIHRPILVLVEQEREVSPGPETPKLKPRLFVLHALIRLPVVVGELPEMEVDTSLLPMILT